MLFTSLMLWAPALRAQTDPQQKAAAEALFDEGRQLMQQGQYESACKRFQQSQEIDRGVGTLLYLGECYERSGKLASAWAIFREAASAARAAGQGDRARIADERSRRLAPTLSKLALLVPDANRVGGFELLLDQRPLSEALFGVPFPIDAGAHELTARAPGRTSWSSIIEIKGNADYRSVQIPVLQPASDGFAAPGVAPSSPAADGTRDTGVQGRDAGLTGQKLTGVILAGAGVLGIGSGVIFGVMAQSQDDEAKQDCTDVCATREGAEKNEDARTSALIANISYGVGAAALAAGAFLFFTADSESESAGALRIAPQLGAGGHGLMISGGF